MKFSKSILSVAVVGALASGAMSTQAMASESKVTIAKAAAVTNEIGEQDASQQAMKRTENFVSSYSSSQSKENLAEQLLSSNKLNKQVMVNGSLTSSKKRSPKRSTLTNQGNDTLKALDHLEIYDASVYLLNDLDGDGFYSKIKLNFDVDSIYDEYTDVYAELFIREQGASQWTYYLTTDVFEIYGNSSSDDYHVTTTFNTGFPTAQYEIAIDLFEYGFSGVVDSLEAVNDGDLGYLPIEDTTYEFIGADTGVSVSTVKTEIFTDQDNDGFYQDFKISFDVDTDDPEREVVAKLYQRTGNSSWNFESETDAYTIVGNNTDDTIAIEGVWTSGYATGYYDFKIEIEDAATGELLAEASNQFGPLVDVPLEDAGKDTQNNGGGGSTGGGTSTTSSESGGGSWSIFGVLLLATLGWIRRK